MEEKYLELLGEQFPTKEAVITEIINLEAILNLPKGTEHFVSDLHGEYDAFDHVLRNGSGNVKVKINDVFQGRISDQELAELTTLIYYPKEKLIDYKKRFRQREELHEWYAKVISQLVEITIHSSSKYTRSKVRKSLPFRFSYIMEELLYNHNNSHDKEAYYDEVIKKIIQLGEADQLITAFAKVIQRFVVDHLHVVGDIYDRGSYPDKIMDRLMEHHSVDIQWGNHDILWMGAVSGSKVCMANLLRICARYDNLDIVEDVYGINLRPLTRYAEKYYKDNPKFHPRTLLGRRPPSPEEKLQTTQIHQGISILQFKLEKEIIQRRPEFEMDHRLLLEQVDFETQTIPLHGERHPLVHTCFSQVDPASPTQLTPEEEEIIEGLIISFQNSEKLRRHMEFLFEVGSLYLVYNHNLLIHGCIPLTETGEMECMVLEGEEYCGAALLDKFEELIRYSYVNPRVSDDLATDIFWYLWAGSRSCLFGKKDMTTFERYFVEDKTTHKEKMNPYFALREDETVCRYILREFGIDPDKGHIINGHTPIKETKGESPIKAQGKMIVIDGGYSRVYQKQTGIGGYTLLYNSYGMELAAHQPFTGREDAIALGTDIVSTRRVVDAEIRRQKIRETNIGEELSEKSADLQLLLDYKYNCAE